MATSTKDGMLTSFAENIVILPKKPSRESVLQNDLIKGKSVDWQCIICAFPRMPMDDFRKSIKDGILRMVLDLEKFGQLQCYQLEGKIELER